MTDKELYKDIIDSPRTMGEQLQSERVQKFNSDSNVIYEVKKDLEQLKSNLFESKKEIEKQIANLEKHKIKHKSIERNYDNLQINKKSKGIFRQLFSFSTIKQLFLKKYGANSKVTWKFFNFILDKPLFFPDRSVYYFVKQLVTQQQELRPYFRKMFRLGWLNNIGEEVLNPFEFNLIGEMERLVYDNSILNFMIYYKQPNTVIKKIGPFIGHFLSLNRNEITRTNLVTAARKSLQNIVYKNSDGIKKIPLIIKRIEDFLSPNVDKDFFIPLFESAYHETFTPEGIRSLISLFDIPEHEYKADNNLKLAMANRKNTFTDEIRKKVTRIEEEIDFIREILEIISKTVNYKTPSSQYQQTVVLPYLEYILLLQNEKDSDAFGMKKKNVAAFIVDICDFFYKTYESLFIEGISIKVGQGIRPTKIFENQIFSDEINTLKKEKRNIAEFIPAGYNFSILDDKSDNKKMTLFFNSLVHLGDAFFSIGEKLMAIIRGHNKLTHDSNKISTTPVIFKNFTSSIIPFYNDKIIKMHTNSHNLFSIQNKNLKEVLQNIIDLCICVAHKFEYKQQDYSQSLRKEPINNLPNRLTILGEKMKKLQAGENIEL